MCSSLKGLVTEGADVTAVLAVGLSTVPSQCVGILAHLITVVTLVPIISLRLAVLPSFMAINSNLDHTQRLVGNILTKAHAYASIAKKDVNCNNIFVFLTIGYLCFQCMIVVSERLKFRPFMVHISIKLCFWDWCVFCIFQAASNWLFMLVKKSIGRHSCFEIGNQSQLIIELPPFLLNSSTYLHLPWISYNSALHR